MSRPLLTYYSDDFTGAADCLEMLERSGVSTVLFLDVPTPADLARYPHAQAVGIAGASRTWSPTAMDQHLPPVFAAMRALAAPINHYKICSTFDSSPHLGSIGRAIECGRQAFGVSQIPLLVAAPRLGRHVAFGNLFARSGLDCDPVRLDRHPTMAHHPSTPMSEADLRRHLALQTDVQCELIDVLTIESGHAAIVQHLRKMNDGLVLFDGITEAHVTASATALIEFHDQRPIFVVGSSGVELGLAAHWHHTGEACPPRSMPEVTPVDRVIVVSGSCSPVTARQIAYAENRGFNAISLDVRELLDPTHAPAAIQRAIAQALAVLASGASPILHTARGPEGLDTQTASATFAQPIGEALGTIVHELIVASGLQRVVIAGGDTSTFAARRLGVRGLRFAAPVAAGGPLCRIQSDLPAIDGLDMLFKGGQVGRDSLFCEARGDRELS